MDIGLVKESACEGLTPARAVRRRAALDAERAAFLILERTTRAASSTLAAALPPGRAA